MAVFRSRAGSPTGKDLSGTIEEIREFMRLGKYVVLYFYEGEVAIGKVDPDQLKIVHEFRNEIQHKGLTGNYKHISELREHVICHLTSIVGQLPGMDASGSSQPEESLAKERDVIELAISIEATAVVKIDTTVHPPDRKSAYTFEATVSNCGTASAYDVFVAVVTNYPAEATATDRFVGGVVSPEEHRAEFSSGRPIHPGETQIGCFGCRVTAPTILYWQAGRTDLESAEQIVFDIAVFARDAAPIKSRVTFDRHELKANCVKSTAAIQVDSH